MVKFDELAGVFSADPSPHPIPVQRNDSIAGKFGPHLFGATAKEPAPALYIYQLGPAQILLLCLGARKELLIKPFFCDRVLNSVILQLPCRSSYLGKGS